MTHQPDKKIDQDIRNHGEVRWKHAMHLLRLLLTGAATLRAAILGWFPNEWHSRQGHMSSKHSLTKCVWMIASAPYELSGSNP